jgi:hypothetical protein
MVSGEWCVCVCVCLCLLAIQDWVAFGFISLYLFAYYLCYSSSSSANLDPFQMAFDIT